MAQDTFVYELVDDDAVVYIGTTDDTDRREGEHRDNDLVFDELVVVAGPMTEKDALAEEDRRLDEFERIHGRLPIYNKRPSG